MSFWNKAAELAKNAGTAIFNELESNANEISEFTAKHESKGDEELFQSLSASRGTQKEKAVIFSLLRKRGYSVEDINARR